MTGCEQVRPSLGVYVLGAIDPAERDDVDQHLSGCRHCRDELAGLAGLPALLGRVTGEQVAELSAPPEELLDSVLGEIADRRRTERRNHRRWLAAATIVLITLIGAGTLLGRSLSDEPRPPLTTPTAPAAGPWISATNPHTHMSAMVNATNKDWGTAMAVHLRGAPPGVKCQLIAVAKNGSRDSVGSWQAKNGGSNGYDGHDGYADFYGSTMIPRDQLASLEIRTLDGTPLLVIPI